MSRKICIVTGSRAEWGLLSPIARRLSETDGVEVDIVATNMHLSERYGLTVNEIVRDGFEVAASVPMEADRDDEVGKAHAMGLCLSGMADAFERLNPDAVMILGDRYEMLAVASAAVVMRIPIIHLHGGEISEGAVDDSIRHAITKMASLHLTATEEFRRRVIRMGEEPESVVNTGAIGVYNIMHLPLMAREELSESVGFDLSGDYVVVTYHPATLDPADPADRMGALIEALDRFRELKVIVTYPNNDARGQRIIPLIDRWSTVNPQRVKAIPSLGLTRYLSALKYARAAVGNSSSGLIEVPSMGIPTVNVGIRQQGRLAGESVYSCGDSADEIARTLFFALSPEGQQKAREAANPYARENTLELIVDAVLTKPLNSSKHFYE